MEPDELPPKKPRPKDTRKRVRNKPKPPKPAPGAVLEHIADPKLGKTRPLVKNSERKIGRPNQRIRSLVNEIANGRTITEAAKIAGISMPPSNTDFNTKAGGIMVRPYAKEMLAAERAQTAVDNKITRKRVIEGLQEAIDMARMLAEPATMIAGWKEIGKMCGLYDAVKVKVDLSTGGATLSTRMMSLSDADLLRIANGESLDDDDAIEGQFEHIEQ